MQTAPRASASPTSSPVAETAAFSEYVQARGTVLLRAARSLTPNPADAEDLLQTALAKTYQAWDRIDDKQAVEGYVRRVLVNTRTSEWRRRRVDEYATDELPELPNPAPDPADQQALRDVVWRAVRRLPPRQQAMVVLRYYEDLSESQTAEVMGTTVGTVKSAVSRALAKMRCDPTLRVGARVGARAGVGSGRPDVGRLPDRQRPAVRAPLPQARRPAC